MPAWLVKAKIPRRDEAEVGDRGVGDQALEVLLTHRQHRAVDDADHSQHEHERRELLRRVGEQRQAPPQEAIGADLVEHADEQDGGADRGLGAGVRQPGVERHQRSLDRERDEEAEEQPVLCAPVRC